MAKANTGYKLQITPGGIYGLGNQTGTAILPRVLDPNTVGNQQKTGTGTTAMKNPGTAAGPVSTASDEPYKAALAARTGTGTGQSDEAYKAALDATRRTGTGTGAGATGAGSPEALELAQRIAESYARTQPGQAPQWNDQWAPQIEALQGQRYGPYDSKYLPQIDGLLDRILNRGDFQYNWSDDPLYRQYAARYQQQARQGMQDTMGQAAGLTGGYGSSYATAAGNQAYAQQMQGLNDRAMELYQLAKDRWDTQGQEMRSNLAALENREASNRAYYQDDRDTWYGRNDADIANLRDSQAMGWAAYQDAADRAMAERQMAWDQYQYWQNLYDSKYGRSGGGSGGSGKSTLAGLYGAISSAASKPASIPESLWRRMQKKGMGGGGSNPNKTNRVQMEK